MFGYMGRVIRIDLTRSEVVEEDLEEGVARKFLGGRGLASYFLFKELSPRVDPLGPENKLVITTGPLVGTMLPGCSGYAAFAKSPLTGGWGEAHAKGWFGSQLKAAGYDALIISGRSPGPCYAWINNGQVEIRDASHIWGKTTGETEDIIRRETGKKGTRIACIGPAGENLVRYACIINDKSHAAGRTGLGAVMGSKKLKAIATYGTRRVQVADEAKLRELKKKALDRIRKSSFYALFSKYGTAGLVTMYNEAGILPTRNFRSGVFEGAKNISGEAINEKVLIRRRPCPACPIACDPIVEVKTGPFALIPPEYGGPEYETTASFGSYCGNDNLEAVAKANMLCNMYGLDTISTGNSIAFAMELYEHGIITKEDTEGIELTWGNPQAIIQMIRKIARREGLGDLLAEGVKRMAEKLDKGSEKFAIHSKGMECPMVEPRAEVGKGLSYATSNRGACHHQYTPFFPEEDMRRLSLTRIPGKTEISRDQAELVVKGENYRTVLPESLIICSFVTYESISMSDIAEFLNAVVGWKISFNELISAGERIFNLCRAFNVREGMTRNDDTIPLRFEKPLDIGPTKGLTLKLDDLNRMLDYYYELRGWNIKTGVPMREKLKEICLEFVIDELEKLGILPSEDES